MGYNLDAPRSISRRLSAIITSVIRINYPRRNETLTQQFFWLLFNNWPRKQQDIGGVLFQVASLLLLLFSNFGTGGGISIDARLLRDYFLVFLFNTDLRLKRVVKENSGRGKN